MANVMGLSEGVQKDIVQNAARAAEMSTPNGPLTQGISRPIDERKNITGREL